MSDISNLLKLRNRSNLLYFLIYPIASQFYVKERYIYFYLILGPFLSLTKVRSAYRSISLYHIGRYGDSECLFSLCSPTIQDNLNLRRTEIVYICALQNERAGKRERERDLISRSFPIPCMRPLLL